LILSSRRPEYCNIHSARKLEHVNPFLKQDYFCSTYAAASFLRVPPRFKFWSGINHHFCKIERVTRFRNDRKNHEIWPRRFSSWIGSCLSENFLPQKINNRKIFCLSIFDMINLRFFSREYLVSRAAAL